MDRDKPYDHRNCSSLFGYAADVHVRSGGVCQLCFAGGDALDFDFWRQLTVEHLIGRSQGGDLSDIRSQLRKSFPAMDAVDQEELAAMVDSKNTVTACHFCNSTTSRMGSDVSMQDLLERVTGDASRLLDEVEAVTRGILEEKRAAVARKLASVRRAYEERVVPSLEAARHGS